MHNRGQSSAGLRILAGRLIWRRSLHLNNSLWTHTAGSQHARQQLALSGSGKKKSVGELGSCGKTSDQRSMERWRRRRVSPNWLRLSLGGGSSRAPGCTCCISMSKSFSVNVSCTKSACVRVCVRERGVRFQGLARRMMQ